MSHPPPLRKEKSARRAKKVRHYVHVFLINLAAAKTNKAGERDRAN